MSTAWKNRKILFIGDSLTAAHVYPEYIREMLDVSVYYHAKGGLGIVQTVDGDAGLGGNYDNVTSASGRLLPLNCDDVTDMDLVVFFAGYNDRGMPDGQVGDVYAPAGGGQNTIAGCMQYAIDRIRDTLQQAGNTKATILIVSIDCPGKYSWIDADGYEDFPAGSGRNTETLANIQIAVAKHNHLPYVDLWHHGAFCRENWPVYGMEAEAVNPWFTKYELDEKGQVIGKEPLRYEIGRSYYQKRGDTVVLLPYTRESAPGGPPYPFNRDQVHKSNAGYRKIAEILSEKILTL